MGEIYNSRFDDEPRLVNGEPVVTSATDDDTPIFQLLNRYRYLPSNFIAAYTGRPQRYLGYRLDLLARKPNKFLNRPAQFESQPKALARFLDYELWTKGKEFLQDEGLYSTEPRFGDETLYAHSRMINEGIVNIEMGARAASHDMIWFPEIAARLKEPHRFIPVHIEYPGMTPVDFDYYNDSNGPFGIHYPNGSRLFLSLEAELTTKSDAPNLKDTSFLKKFLAMRYINDHELYRTQWGLPNLMHLVLCHSQARIDSRKELILRVTNGKGVSYVAFALAPTLKQRNALLVPDPALYTRPWQRAGYPDLPLSEPPKQKGR